ncbi:MAG TPA: acetyl-coenzyme A synthetase N-terminal domain-containing protein [Baekduia sp.]
MGQCLALHWFEAPQSALNDENPRFCKWFEGDRVNASYNCLDRHVEAGLGDRVAFKSRGEEGESEDIFYAWLLEQTQRAANALKTRASARATWWGSSCR